MAAAAALKELYDWFNPWSHSPEMRDAIATVCGVLPLWASVKLMAAWPDLLPGFFKLFVF